MLVKDAMQAEIVLIHPQATLWEAARQMVASGLDTLFVMEGDRLVGVVGLRDLFTAPIPAHYGGRMADHREETRVAEVWRRTAVSQIMNDRVICTTEDSPLLKAAALMVNGGKHPLPVLRDGKVVGVIARADVVRALLPYAPAEEGGGRG